MSDFGIARLWNKWLQVLICMGCVINWWPVSQSRQVLFQFSLSCLKHLQVSPLVCSGTLIPPIYRWTFFSSYILFSLPIDGIFHIFSTFFFFLISKHIENGDQGKVSLIDRSFFQWWLGECPSLFTVRRTVCWPGRGCIATHTLYWYIFPFNLIS